MKRSTLLFLFLLLATTVQAQYYTWQQSDTVTVTAVDSTFAYRWEQCQFWFSGCDGYVRIGAPDTTSWSSRTWTKVADGQIITIDYRTPFVKQSFKSVSGAGRLYRVGIKRRAQW
jgi:hypothetical protein